MNIRIWIAICVALLLVYMIAVALIVGPKEEDVPESPLGDHPATRDLKP